MNAMRFPSTSAHSFLLRTRRGCIVHLRDGQFGIAETVAPPFLGEVGAVWRKKKIKKNKEKNNVFLFLSLPLLQFLSLSTPHVGRGREGVACGW